MAKAVIDLVGKSEDGQLMTEGSVASVVGNSFNINSMRPFIGNDGKVYVNHKLPNGETKAVEFKGNATLRNREWIDLDMAVQRISRERLIGTTDLTSRGLVYNLTNPMGRTVLEYHDMSDPGSATISMDGVTRGQNDRPKYGTNYIPLPIIHSDFTINDRVLQASRNMGESIDTSMAEACARRILETLEDLFFTNTSYTYGGGTITSYISNSNKNTVTLSANWDAAGKTGAQIIADVLSMKQASIDAKHYGPWMLYIPTSYETKLDADYDSTTPGTTIRERIMKIEGISGMRVVDRLTADTVVMVQMTSDVVRLINGFSPRVIEWDSQGGMIHNFKVMAIQVPQIRADQDGNSGITVLAGAS